MTFWISRVAPKHWPKQERNFYYDQAAVTVLVVTTLISNITGGIEWQEQQAV